MKIKPHGSLHQCWNSNRYADITISGEYVGATSLMGALLSSIRAGEPIEFAISDGSELGSSLALKIGMVDLTDRPTPLFFGYQLNQGATDQIIKDVWLGAITPLKGHQTVTLIRSAEKAIPASIMISLVEPVTHQEPLVAVPKITRHPSLFDAIVYEMMTGQPTTTQVMAPHPFTGKVTAFEYLPQIVERLYPWSIQRNPYQGGAFEAMTSKHQATIFHTGLITVPHQELPDKATLHQAIGSCWSENPQGGTLYVSSKIITQLSLA